jgi:hypothetical protein
MHMECEEGAQKLALKLQPKDKIRFPRESKEGRR